MQRWILTAWTVQQADGGWGPAAAWHGAKSDGSASPRSRRQELIVRRSRVKQRFIKVTGMPQ